MILAISAGIDVLPKLLILNGELVDSIDKWLNLIVLKELTFGNLHRINYYSYAFITLYIKDKYIEINVVVRE